MKLSNKGEKAEIQRRKQEIDLWKSKDIRIVI